MSPEPVETIQVGLTGDVERAVELAVGGERCRRHRQEKRSLRGVEVSWCVPSWSSLRSLLEDCFLRSLLEDDFVPGLEAREHFDAAAVGDSGLDGDDAVAVFAVRVRDPDAGVAILVVEDGLLGDGEGVLVFFEDDLGVGGHVGLELAAGIVDGDLDLEGGDVILLDAERSDLGDAAGEGAAGEALDLDARGLAEIDLGDVGLVDFAFDVDLVGIAEGHDEGCRGAEDEDGADGVADLHVAGEDDAVDGRGDGGVGELLFELLEGGFGLLDEGLALVELGVVDGDLGDGLVADVEGGEILLVGVVQGLLGEHAVLLHLQGAMVGVLEHGKVGGFGGDLIEGDGGGGGVGAGDGSG